ncbi:large ribosomal subunit protein uL22m [Monosporozyma servazzii]
MMMIPRYMNQISRRVVVGSRLLQTTSRVANSSESNNNTNSLFGNLGTTTTTTSVESKDKVLENISNRLEMSMEDEGESGGDGGKKNVKDTITPETDTELQDFIKSKRRYERTPQELLLSPLKRQIYELNCRRNGGFYKADTVVKLPDSGKKYKLHLSRDEIEILEPSLYLQSYRIKSTLKKATKFLRMFRGIDLEKGITQCHFSKKGLGKEVGDLLEQGLKDAQKMNLDCKDLYISRIWTGSDGAWMKRVDIKGRGRMGIITHRYIHVKCVLKSKSVTLKRLEHESRMKQERRKPWIQLANEPIRGVMGGAYRW